MPRPTRAWHRLVPLVFLLLFAGLVFVTGSHRHLSLDALAAHHAALRIWVEAHPVVAPLAFAALYAAAVTVSVPGVAIGTLAAGLLFGAAFGTALVVTAATLGASLAFLVARTARGTTWRRRADGWIARFEAGFREDAFSYLLVLRLVPVFPFWLVNIAPALLGMRLRTYVAATALGILPATAVIASAGQGLGAVLAAGGRPSFALVFGPEVVLPLVGLALVALLPVLHKRWRRSRIAR